MKRLGTYALVFAAGWLTGAALAGIGFLRDTPGGQSDITPTSPDPDRVAELIAQLKADGEIYGGG